MSEVSEVTLFRKVNIFDGENEQLLEGYDVLVVKNLIKEIGKDIEIADSYEIDVKTGGLKEMHTHGGHLQYYRSRAQSGYRVRT
jgi:hypothetical protein